MAPTEAPKTEASTAPAVVRAKNSGAVKGKQLSATVTEEFLGEFSELQWDLRKPVPELIRIAAEEFLSKYSTPEGIAAFKSQYKAEATAK